MSDTNTKRGAGAGQPGFHVFHKAACERFNNLPPGYPRAALVEHGSYGCLDDVPPEKWQSFLDLLVNYIPPNRRQQQRASDKPKVIPIRETKWTIATKIGDQIGEGLADVATIVPGYVPAFGVTALVAEKDKGKTLVLVDLACCFALNRPWGTVEISHDLTPVYLAGEDYDNTERHIKAWAIERNGGVMPHIIFIRDVPDLFDQDDCDGLVAHIRTLLPSGAVPVFFLDTWQRATSRGKQNADDEMQQAFKRAEGIASAFGASAIMACHPPKGAAAAGRMTILGSSVIENMTTAILHMEPDTHHGYKVGVERVKGRRGGLLLFGAHKVVEIGGKEKNGAPFTGAVVVHRGGGVATQQDDTERSQWAAAIRAVIEYSGVAKLTGNAVFTALAKLEKDSEQRHGITLTNRDSARERAKVLFEANPVFDFPDGVVRLTLVKATKRGNPDEWALVRNPMSRVGEEINFGEENDTESE